MNDHYDVLIIGGGAAGTTAAETYRRGGGKGSVAIISHEAHPLYSRVLLPHAVKDRVPLGGVMLKDGSFYDDHDIAYLGGRTAVDIDPEKRTAALEDGTTIGFGQLVIATGGDPRPWDIPGAELEGVMRLQTYEDAREIAARAKQDGDMVIIGAGFIGLEFAAIAAHYGMPATLFHRGRHFCDAVFGEGAAGVAVRALGEAGVVVEDDARIMKVLGDNVVEGVELDDGRRIACTMVGVGIGLDLNIAPFREIGTETGILADETLATRHDGIWAAGDCAEFHDDLLGIRHVVGNWTNAMAQGRHVGMALLGDKKPFRTLTSYTSNCLPGLGLIFIGETRLNDRGDRVARIIEKDKSVIEFHFHEDRVIGAVLVNAPKERKAAEAMIRAHLPLADKKDALADPTYPLASLSGHG